LTLILEDGARFLKSRPPRSYDLVFADAMQGKYEGLEAALAVVRVGGFYVIDDMLPQEDWPEGNAAKVPLLLERLAQDHDFVMVPIKWSSGVAVAVRQIRTGCANQRPSGSVRGATRNGCPYRAQQSVKEGLGWGWMRNAFHPEDRAEEEWRAAFAAGQPFEKEARLRRAAGTYRCFLLRAGSDPIPLDKGGPVGVLPNSDYESDKIDLRHGDVLVLYTDEAVEAENQAREQYSAARLAKIASMYSQQSR
jgi:Stage II sporulation protein E (SpoIIE)/PAS fold